MDETIARMGDIADSAISQHHSLSYADRMNALLDALHLISQERIEWQNSRDVLPVKHCPACGAEYHGVICPMCHGEYKEAANG